MARKKPVDRRTYEDLDEVDEWGPAEHARVRELDRLALEASNRKVPLHNALSRARMRHHIRMETLSVVLLVVGAVLATLA